MKRNQTIRRLIVLLEVLALMLVLLTGCGLSGSNTYVVITPHDEQPDTNASDHTITANSYLSLKNAVLGIISAGTEEGTIRVEAYTADVPEDISQIVYEVSRQNPVGAYMVDYMTYDYSKIVNYYDVSLHITFKHDAEELSNLVSLSDSSQVEDQLEEALACYQNSLLLDISTYTDVDVEEMVLQLLENNPEINLCIPEVTENLYPEAGSHRILEIKFNYPADTETMLQARDTLEDALEEYTVLYQDLEDKESVCKRVYNRLCRNADVVTAGTAESPFYDSIYGAIIDKAASEKSYAAAYQQILLRCGIYCSLVNATYHRGSKVLCRVEINNAVFYVDPAEAVKTKDMTDFRIDPLELIDQGYTILG